MTVSLHLLFFSIIVEKNNFKLCFSSITDLAKGECMMKKRDNYPMNRILNDRYLSRRIEVGDS